MIQKAAPTAVGVAELLRVLPSQEKRYDFFAMRLICSNFATEKILMMNSEECISKLSKMLFWDIDIEKADMDRYPRHIIQRVLEYGTLEDWRIIHSYYGLDKIVEECKQMRTLDPVCLAFICAKSNTKEEEYRCYHTRQSFPTLWNS